MSKWSLAFVTLSRIEKTKPKNHESTLEETWPDHVICSTVTATKLPLCCCIFQKRNNKKETCRIILLNY